MQWKSFLVVWVFGVRAAMALGPHEVAVLVHEGVGESVRVAETFVRLRDVPERNVIRLTFPEAWAPDPPNGISRENFTRYIWEPVNTALIERGLDGQVLAWVYSTKFPIFIQGRPPVSIQGITFLRNALPDAELIDRGKYRSPLFTGPSHPKATGHYPQSFDVAAQWLGDEMPLPSMMLGYTGAHGNREEVVMAGLRRGRRSDGTSPTGTVWFVESDDVRSRARQWQFPGAVEELRQLGIRAEIRRGIPRGTGDILGATLGASRVTPERWAYQPGCMAEHLTSLAAVFSEHRQTRLTAWLEAGVTASAGTVTEPYAAWSKFPTARFHAHYARGCTMIESFFQSIACPLQILLVGEPLASPWRPDAELVVEELRPGAVWTGTVNLHPVLRAAKNYRTSRFVLLVDGRVAAEGRTSLKVDSTRFADGEHVVRVVAVRTGLVRHQVHAESRVRVSNAAQEAGGMSGNHQKEK